MKTLLVLLAILGGSMAEQPSRSMRYQYYGEVKTLFPELMEKGCAGSGISATLLVTWHSSTQAFVKITNVTVGEVSTEEMCSYESELPIKEWKSIHETADVEKPFAVHFSGRQEILEVPKFDRLWVGNLRKVIISLLRIPFVMSDPPNSFSNLRTNSINHGNTPDTSFKKLEKTVLGECYATYTMKQLPKWRPLGDKVMKEEMKEGRIGDRDYYRMVRSVDLQDCPELVVSTKTSHGNYSNAGKGHMANVETRGTTSQYILSGRPGGVHSMRVESVTVDGVLTKKMYTPRPDTLSVLTRQMLKLETVSGSELVPRPTGHMGEEPWLFSAVSPFQKARDSPSWVSFMGRDNELYPFYPEKQLTGLDLTDEMRRNLKEEIIDLIHTAARYLALPNAELQKPFGGSKYGAAVLKTESAISRMRALPLSDLDDVFQQLLTDTASARHGSELYYRRHLTIGAFKSAGSPASIRILVEAIKKNSFSKEEIITVFSSMTQNIGSPAVLSDLIAYAKSLPDDADTQLKASVLVNLSNMVRRLCISATDRKTSVPAGLLGTVRCRQTVKLDYSRFLIHKLKSESNTNMIAVYLQALIGLGDQAAVEALGEFIKNPTGSYPFFLRILALSGLTSNNIVNTSYPEVETILLSVFEDQSITYAPLRVAALVSLFSLPKNFSTWQRLAATSWQESSYTVSEFIYDMVLSVASVDDNQQSEQRAMAQQILPYVRPAGDPYRKNVAFFKYINTYVPSRDMRIFGLEYSVGVNNLLPPSFLSESVDWMTQGGMLLPILDVQLGGMGTLVPHVSLFSRGEASAGSPRYYNPQSPLSRAALLSLSNPAGGPETDQAAPDIPRHPPLFTRINFLKHIELFAPSLVEGTAHNFFLDTSHKMSAYVDAIGNSEFVPCDLGLPIVTQAALPVFVDTAVEAPDLHDKRKYSLKLVVQALSNVKILVPWSNKTVELGVDLEVSASTSGEFSLMEAAGGGPSQISQFSITPTSSSESPSFMYMNRKFAQVRDILPTTDVTEQDVHIFEDPRHNHNPMTMRMPKALTGLEAKLEYQGDVEATLDQSNWMMMLKDPSRLFELFNSPRAMFQKVALYHDSEKSTTKTFTFTAQTVKTEEQRTVPSDRVSVVTDLSASDSAEDRLQKLANGKVSSMMSVSLNLTGSEPPRKVELALLQLKTPMSGGLQEGPVSREHSALQINLMRSKMPWEQQDKQVCVSGLVQYPELHTHQDLTQVLRSDLKSGLMAEVRAGHSCSPDNTFFTLKGSTSVTTERKELLRKTLPTARHYQPLDSGLSVGASAVYDKLDLEIQKLKSLSNEFRNASQKAQELLHGLLFPHFTHNTIDVQGKPGLTVLNATRSLSTDEVTMWTRSEESICLGQGLRVPPILDHFSPLSGSRQVNKVPGKSQRWMAAQSEPSNKCVLTPTSVKTFAGLNYDKLETVCDMVPLLAVVRHHMLVVEAIQPGSRQLPDKIRITFSRDNLHVEQHHDGVFVAGKKLSPAQTEVKDPSGHLLATVQQGTGGRSSVTIPHIVTTEYVPGGAFTIKTNRGRQVGGICGSNKLNSQKDLMDRQGCVYTPEEGKLFAFTWMIDSKRDQCIKEERREVKLAIAGMLAHQETCIRDPTGWLTPPVH